VTGIETPAAWTATRLTQEQLTALRDQAKQAVTGFVDPAQLQRVSSFVAGKHEWATAVLGSPFNLRSMTNRQLVLLDLAAAAEPEPPVRPRPPAPGEPGYVPSEAELARKACWEAKEREWQELAAAMPVKVSVAYNHSGPLHLENYVSGAEHIIVREPLTVGKLRRDARQSLCWTPSRAKHLLFCHYDTPEDRVPSCKDCVRKAYKITGRQEPSKPLLEGKRR
jgi:hypothetical protein